MLNPRRWFSQETCSPERDCPPRPAGSAREALAKGWWDGLLILVAVAAGLTSHFWWLWHHHVPPESDYSLHLAEAAAFQAVLDSPGNLLEKIVTAWTWPGPYPPMVYLVTWVFTWFLPGGSYAALASLSFFLACLVVGAYVLGTAAGGRAVGLAAAFLVQADPTILNSMRRYWVDVPAAAMVVLSLALLVLSRGFRCRGWSLAFGICLAAGMLSKFTLIWYLALPLLVAMAAPLREANRSQRLWFLALLVAWAILFKMLCALGWARGTHYMQGTDTMAPALSYAMLAAWIAACALYWREVSRRLAGPLRHLSHALCLAGLLLAPWFLANQAMVQGRWNPAVELIPRNLAEFPVTIGYVVTDNIKVVLWSGLLGLLVIPFLKGRRPALLPVLLAFVTGTALTLILLTCSPRYRAPSQALLAILAVSWLPRTRFVTLPVLAFAICLSSVNLFTDLSLARVPALGAILDRYTWETRRLLVDRSDFPWTDFEPFSRELVARLPSTTSSIFVLTSRNDVDRLSNLYFMILAENWWRARVVACRLICTAGGKAEHMQVCVLEPDRTRMLARRRQLPVEQFPRMFGDDAFVPEIVIVSLPCEQPQALAASLFGAPYRPEDFPPEYGFAVLRCTGSHGRRPSTPELDADGFPVIEPGPSDPP